MSISPSDGAVGVSKDAKIVVQFSEPMNKPNTQAAYQSSDLPNVNFNWLNNTRLEIDPVNNLEYTNSGKVYTFRINNTATDLAGNALTAVNLSFRTLRELTRTLKSTDELDGWIAGNAVDWETGIAAGDSDAVGGNAQFKGFVSFDLSRLETDGLTSPNRITSATLRVYQESTQGLPFTGLELGGQRLLIAHVDYGSSFEVGDFNTPILQTLGQLSNNNMIGWRTAPGSLEAVRNDWINRASRGNRSQYMISFPKATNSDGIQDVVVFNDAGSATNQPELEVKFLLP